ncbi:7-carboxy-7-deazaguanine synthase QueE [Gracilibacillus dipsosauri]|uniref:7-carboxy-7-deazaguanine synthase QueE n=1 Tax=Gracilibacillus dipsosauri TaxID=178340 RepID=UPI00240917CE
MSKIPVLEIFGPTIQGEGMVVGRKTMFVRTAGCDYQCSWCDSAFTWDGSAKEEIRQMTADEIMEELHQIGKDCFDHVTISGGNPALLASIGELVALLNQKGIEIALETQGSRWQDWMKDIDDLTISPKPPSSGMKTNFEILDQIIEKLTNSQKSTGLLSLKIVIFEEDDFEYAIGIHERYRNIPLFLQVGNDDTMCQSDQQLALMLLEKYEWLINKTTSSSKLNNVRVLPQLHTLVWGNKRGY